MPGGPLRDADRDKSNTMHLFKGTINGGFFEIKPEWPAPYPTIVIGIDDIHKRIEMVTQSGGKVLGEPMTIPGVGEYVSFMDTEGNRVSMIEPEM